MNNQKYHFNNKNLQKKPNVFYTKYIFKYIYSFIHKNSRLNYEYKIPLQKINLNGLISCQRLFDGYHQR